MTDCGHYAVNVAPCECFVCNFVRLFPDGLGGLGSDYGFNGRRFDIKPIFSQNFGGNKLACGMGSVNLLVVVV